MRLKEWNIKHAQWLWGRAARPLMRTLSWIEPNIRWKQQRNKKNEKRQWGCNECVHGWTCWPHSWANWSPYVAQFCLVGQIKKLNAKWLLVCFFHILRNATFLSHFWLIINILIIINYLNWESLFKLQGMLVLCWWSVALVFTDIRLQKCLL